MLMPAISHWVHGSSPGWLTDYITASTAIQMIPDGGSILACFVSINNAESPIQLPAIESMDETHYITKRNALYSEQYGIKPAYSSSYPTAYMATPNPYQYPAPQYSCPFCNKTEDCNKCELTSGICTKDEHLTGCFLRDCTSADTLLIGYTCYCQTAFPAGCVFTEIGESPCADESHGFFCKCNGPRKSPTNCSIGKCKPGEQTSATTTCKCGNTEDTRPCGCVRESASAFAHAFATDVVLNGGKRMEAGEEIIVVVV
ncbi:unnamed protein product [Orchesella dallaii]|uniref:Uncharacterized protein n=1 Tax=Orchesella dallaii TaxID=48710 RepID=A0ABP1Q2U2_9HEXA